MITAAFFIGLAVLMALCGVAAVVDTITSRRQKRDTTHEYEHSPYGEHNDH